MACLYAIEAYGPDADICLASWKSIRRVDRIDRLISHYKADCPVSRLNREAARGPVTVDAELSISSPARCDTP